MRQIARRAGMERREQQERAGCFRRDQVAGQFAREVKAALEIDRMHLRPDLGRDGHGVIGLASRRRGAVDEMGHPPERRLRVLQQRLTRGWACEIADPRQRDIRSSRGLDRRHHPLLADIGEHGPHAFADQCLGDGAPNAVTGAGYQRRLARRVERVTQQAHRSFLSACAGSIRHATCACNVFQAAEKRPNLPSYAAGPTMRTRVRKTAHVLERLGLAMAGAASGLFVAALVGTSVAALTTQAFLLLMMLAGAVGFYLGIDTPPLPFHTPIDQPPDGDWVGKIDTPEFLSAVGTFLAAAVAFVSVGVIVLRRDPHIAWTWTIMAGWVVGVTMQIVSGAIARLRR
jgi:hypothetical protein